MHLDHLFSKIRILILVFAAVALIFAGAVHVHLARAQSNSAASAPLSDSELVAQFRHVEVASVSDALEQITHKKMYMSHRMQPIFTFYWICSLAGESVSSVRSGAGNFDAGCSLRPRQHRGAARASVHRRQLPLPDQRHRP